MVYDVIIVGAGIVGMATAMKIKQQKPDFKVLVLEKEGDVAQHQTGHNSGVIHSGLYYKPGSHKALNCIDGYNQLIKFCDEEGVNYDLCGKIVVATDQKELDNLNTLYERGVENGLKNLKRLTAAQIKEYEPYCNGIAGLHVPQTGIIDYTEVTKKYLEVFQDRLGGDIRFHSKVEEIRLGSIGVEVITGRETFRSKLVVNCAGLYSDRIAQLALKKLDVRIIPFRGEYYEIKPNKHYLVKNLIYPVPDPAFPFLGVHFTRMINGGVEAGPNAVLAYKREGYKKTDVNISELTESLTWKGFLKVASKYWPTGLGEVYRSYSKAAFTKALQRLLPDLKQSDLKVGGSGVRAQACDKNGGLIDDFLFVEEDRMINVLNAPSPAATSSLAIGDTIAAKAIKRLEK
ncbi:L-2-hydroxyglutarate oxidase [Flammeovirga yaeyamensis]|uniref:L-2-hydroxyglutarate oxidase n=1 Tax=Flammeovirga yaeyamensis TaxID=367791 RepID=A0AAX1N7T1_9BACT|nr:L-2-hydroxyglutarate oxidase [Flammeovirga yaeyamensis]MBB3699073.1 L-2-hydroxyglutarate oxidase [Flammeovirga yaeyamensis]NMF36507.1 L-2-hydroxyglutarate oxidase [Flammeovirga yaeyamensis]QWG03535.1 L-2-hydroxyglutarate oxidase [Flammeovirga yaeyamensis]